MKNMWKVYELNIELNISFIQTYRHISIHTCKHINRSINLNKKIKPLLTHN